MEFSKNPNEWRQIADFPNYYVSVEGDVYSVCSNRMVSQIKNPYGYYEVHLSSHGKTKHRRIHRLVGEAFIPNPQNKPQINHIDGNKANNHISNLEWATAQENTIHAFKTGLAKGTVNGNLYVKQYDKKGNFIAEYISLSDASRAVDTEESDISSACKGKLKTCKGYIWRYSNDDFQITDEDLYKATHRQGKTVAQLDKNDETIAIYRSAMEASKSTGVSRASICRVAGKTLRRGKYISKTAGGYKWKYI